MATIIKLNCINQELTFAENPLVASGGVNEDKLEINFCELWNGYAKICVFYQNPNKIYYSMMEEDNTCVIPHEVLKDDGVLFIGVFGCNTNNETRTSQIVKYVIEKGAISTTTEPPEPTQDIYEQLLSKYKTILEISQKTYADEQTFETNINNQWSTYKTNLTKQQNDYETTMNTSFDEYKASIPEVAKSSIANLIVAQELTLGTTWTQDSTNGYYTQTVNMSGIKSTDTPVLDVKLTGTASNIKALSKEWANILKAETLEGSIKFYAKKATSTALTVLVKVG